MILTLNHLKYSKINIVADGQFQQEINSNCKIIVQSSFIKAKLIYLDLMEDYFSKLRNKLNWTGNNNF